MERGHFGKVRIYWPLFTTLNGCLRVKTWLGIQVRIKFSLGLRVKVTVGVSGYGMHYVSECPHNDKSTCICVRACGSVCVCVTMSPLMVL